MVGILVHSDAQGSCQKAVVQEIAENCDNEYHLSIAALLAQPQRRPRAMRGRLRMLDEIERMRLLRAECRCDGCRSELERQIELQTQGINEIDELLV